MSFILMACTDIRAQKVNIELPFERPPASLEALRTVLERIFRQEEEAIKYTMGYIDTRACEPFTINRLQRYDDDSQRWVDLPSIEALQTYDQLYVFRKNSTKADISTQRELPPPRASEFFYDPFATGVPTTPRTSLRIAEDSGAAASAPFRAGYGERLSPNHTGRIVEGSPYSASGGVDSVSAPRSSGWHTASDPYPASRALPTGATSVPTSPRLSSSFYYKERTTPERVEYLFNLGSQNSAGGLMTEKSFEHILRMAGVTFPAEVLQDLFSHFSARAGDGATAAAISKENFEEFSVYFPVLVNIAYQRITNQDREEAIHAAQRENTKQLENARRQLSELEARLVTARKEVQQSEQRNNRLQEDLYEISLQRDPEYCQEEQKLLDKEVSVFKYRERLCREERDYERLAIERRRRAVAVSARVRSKSPRGTNDPNRYGPRD